MPGRINGFSLAYSAVGAVVMWSGIKGETISDTFKGLLSGQAPTQNTEQIGTPSLNIGTPDASSIASATASASGESGGTNNGNKANQAIGKILAAPYGWATGQEWDDLVSLWNRESGWNNTADNPQSGAYGIPQSLPYSKMPKAAWPPSDGGSASASAQISWGLSYIKSTYGSPSAAWAHEVSAGWY